MMLEVNAPMADSSMPKAMLASLPNMVDTAKVHAASMGGLGTGCTPIVQCLQNGTYVPGPDDPPGYYDASAPACYSQPCTTIVGAMPSTGPVTNAPGITPQYLLDRLPSIVQPAPVVKPPECDPLTQWVTENQLLVGIGMAVLAYMVWHGKTAGR